MLKVQVLYKLSMYETDWTMTEEEYSEFIASAQGLPRPMLQKSDPVLLEDIPWHGAKTPSLVKDQEIARLLKLLQERDTTIEEMNIFFQDRSDGRILELEKELERKNQKLAIAEEMIQMNKDLNTATGITLMETDKLLSMKKVAQELSKEMGLKEFLDQPAWRPKDPSDRVEVPKAVEIVPEIPEIVPIIPETMPTWITEVQRFSGIVQETPKKVSFGPDDKFKVPSSLNSSRKKPGRQGRDYTKHLKMMDNNDPVNDIVKALIEDYKLTKAAAQSTYNNIKRIHERRKVNQNMLDSKEKVSVIPSSPVTIVKPSNSKIPRNLREEIACMPEYESPINFKDAIITREYCNLYDIATLKAYYKETHENIKW